MEKSLGHKHLAYVSNQIMTPDELKKKARNFMYRSEIKFAVGNSGRDLWDILISILLDVASEKILSSLKV